jgi:NADH-quinone oxidoreductase subunit A
MLFEYANVLFGLIFGALFVVLNISVLNRILAPKVKNEAKESIYECGEPAIGSAWVRFDMRFYTVALVFLIFEVEAAVMFPWAVVFKRLRDLGAAGGHGFFVFGEILVFILILAVGLVYVWKKGDLDWVKSTLASRRAQEGEGRQVPGAQASAESAR